jgi:hypothetical protein
MGLSLLQMAPLVAAEPAARKALTFQMPSTGFTRMPVVGNGPTSIKPRLQLLGRAAGAFRRKRTILWRFETMGAWFKSTTVLDDAWLHSLTPCIHLRRQDYRTCKLTSSQVFCELRQESDAHGHLQQWIDQHREHETFRPTARAGGVLPWRTFRHSIRQCISKCHPVLSISLTKAGRT